MATGKTNQYAYFHGSNGDGGECNLRVKWSETYDVAGNYSVVTIEQVDLAINSYTGNYNGDMVIQVDGQTVISLNGNNASNHVGAYTQSLSSYNEVKTAGEGHITGSSGHIAHNSDGKKKVNITVRSNNWSWPGFRDPYYGYQLSNNSSVEITLTDIPRKSDFSVSGTTIGGNMTISITRASSSFTHKLYYAFGSEAYTQMSGAGSVATSYTWSMATPLAEALGGKIPTAFSGTWHIKCETWNGSANLGETVKDVVLRVPSDSSSVPACAAGYYSVGFSNTGTAAANLTNPVCVAGYSKLTFGFTDAKITAKFGASITSKKVYVGSTEITSSGSWTIPATVQLTVEVKDSRGQVVRAYPTVTAQPYYYPSLVTPDAKRCTNNGTIDEDEGTYWYAQADGNCAPLSGENSYGITAAIKSPGGTYGAENTVPAYPGKYVPSVGSLDPTSSYVVRITITDTLNNSTSMEITIPTADVTMHFKTEGHAIGIGKYVEPGDDYILDVKWDTRVEGDLVGAVTGRVLGLGEAREQIPASADINDYKEPGVYSIKDDTRAATLNNLPVPYGGTLRVWNSLGNNLNPGDPWYFFLQEYCTAYGSMYRRQGYATGTPTTFIWSSWYKMFSSKDYPDAVQAVGDVNNRLTTADQDPGDDKLIFFHATSSMTTNKPARDGHILHFAWDNTSPAWANQLFVANGQGGEMQVRGHDASSWGPWRNILVNGGSIRSVSVSGSYTVSAHGSVQVVQPTVPTGYEYFANSVTGTEWEVVPHVVIYQSKPTLVLANVSSSSRSTTLSGKIYFIKS